VPRCGREGHLEQLAGALVLPRAVSQHRLPSRRRARLADYT
jgi:hypothetical protein